MSFATMDFAPLARRIAAQAPTTGLDRRSFFKFGGAGAFALAFAPGFAQNAAAPAGLKPNQIPAPSLPSPRTAASPCR